MCCVESVHRQCHLLSTVCVRRGVVPHQCAVSSCGDSCRRGIHCVTGGTVCMWTSCGKFEISDFSCGNRRVSQMRAPLAACREPAGSYNGLPYMCYKFFFFYIKRYVPALWHFDISVICPHRFRSQIYHNTPMFYIAAIFVKYCYTTASWLL